MRLGGSRGAAGKGAVVLALLLAFAWLAPMVSRQLWQRPVAIKAGHLPRGEVLRLVSGEYAPLVASGAVIRTLFYFGAVLEKNQNNLLVEPEYRQMYHNLAQALKLDPYNQDAYYFSQAVFTWGLGRIRETNQLLDHGMKYRTWDWQLPFWAGFNRAYFLKDSAAAAPYFEQAARLSGNPTFANLAARYHAEAGQEVLGLAFLRGMMASARNERARQLYRTRYQALEALHQLRQAVIAYQQRHGRLPKRLTDLVTAGILPALPSDPYGGAFYLDEAGQVQTSSKLSFARPAEPSASPAPQPE